MVSSDLVPLISYIMAWPRERVILSDDRLTKTIYLVDWRHAIKFGMQATGIHWQYGEYGPTTTAAVDAIKDRPGQFALIERPTILNRKKYDIQFNGPGTVLLPLMTKQSVDEVMNVVHSLEWGQFIQFVYSTYPMTAQDMSSDIDLARLAPQRKLLTRS